MIEIGTRIRELRVSKKMSQKELAERLNVTPQAVSKWELNKSYPDLDTLVRLSTFFQVSTDKLLGNAKQSFFDSLFKKEGRETMKKENSSLSKNEPYTTPIPNGILPKAVKVTNMAHILQIEFDNGEIRYLKSHYTKEMSEAFSPSKGKGKRAHLLSFNRNMWIGTEVEIKEDGTVIINEKDHYTPEELWGQSKASIPEL